MKTSLPIFILTISTFWNFTIAQESPADKAREDLAYTIGVQAYIYGYATVELYRTMYKQSLDPNNENKVGINEFSHVRKLATPEDTWVVTPNNDTYYSRAWLDLSSEPIVLHIPEIKNRFYAFPIGDFYHDAVATLGWWNVGENGGDFALTAPNWQGVLPKGVEKVEVSTPLCWILARTLATDEQNSVERLNTLQDKYTLTPLSEWGSSELSNASFDRNYPQVDEDNPLDFYVILNEMLRFNPPRPADEGLVATFKEIGLHPSQQFDLNSIDEPTKRGLLRAVKDAKMIVASEATRVATIINGWLVLPGPKEFGTDYLYRAALESFALLHGESEMTVGYLANFDGEGNLLDGSNNYELKFDVPPPVSGFWSLTMYDGKTKLLVDNSIDRYSIGDRTKGIVYNDDGSLIIHISHDKPKGKAGSNWLPSPRGPFYVVIRAYNAGPEIFNGSWNPPALKKAD